MNHATIAFPIAAGDHLCGVVSAEVERGAIINVKKSSATPLRGEFVQLGSAHPDAKWMSWLPELSQRVRQRSFDTWAKAFKKDAVTDPERAIREGHSHLNATNQRQCRLFFTDSIEALLPELTRVHRRADWETAPLVGVDSSLKAWRNRIVGGQVLHTFASHVQRLVTSTSIGFQGLSPSGWVTAIGIPVPAGCVCLVLSG